MTVTYSGDMMFHVASEEHWPNVVRLEIPTDHDNDGAAWVYVPHNNTIYIGPPGSHGSGGSVDLATTIRQVTDIQKGEKLVSGVLYDDGYVDYFQATSDDQQDALVGSLQNYHDAYYEGNGSFRGKTKEYMNYPTEDDTSFDPEDDNTFLEDADDAEWEAARPTLNADDLDDNWKWLADRDWSGKSDYSKMKLTPGTSKPIEEWTPEEHHAWKDLADEKRKGGGGGSWGATREDYNHFRWSFGNSSLIKGAPHEGLWLWPTEHGYPDHYSQTGSEGLGNAAQGRVYPHLDGTWEILTWPERPRYVNDPQIKSAIQAQAEAAVKEYLINKVNVDPSKIFFTKMGYGEAVSSHNSESYPGHSYKHKPQWSGGGASYDWDTDKGAYDYYGQTSIKYDNEGNASYTQTYDPHTQRMKSVPIAQGTIPAGHWDSEKRQWIPRDKQESQFFDSSPGIVQKVVDKVKNKLKSPEDRWAESVRQHELAQGELGDAAGKATQGVKNLTDQWRDEDDADIPGGTSVIQHGPNAKYRVHKSDGKVTVVTEQDYNLAVEEYGPEHWYLAFLSPKEHADHIDKVGATDMITDPEEEFTQKFLDHIKSGPQPTGQSYFAENGPIKQEAFLWLGIGYGEDAGEGDIKDAEFLTGTAHWQIVNKLTSKSFPNIADFLYKAKGGEFQIPMVWGWAAKHPMLKGVVITFLTHLGEMKQDLEFFPQALAAAAHHYDMPILDYDIQDSETPILETHPVTKTDGDGGSPPDPGLATAPSPAGAEHQVRILPQKERVVLENQVGFVTIQTYHLGKGELYETTVQGGDLDGHVFPSYSFDEAKGMHHSLVEQENSYQAKTSATIQDAEPNGGWKLPNDIKPMWSFIYGWSPELATQGNVIFVYTMNQLADKLKEQGISSASVVAGRIGQVMGSTWVYETQVPVTPEQQTAIEQALEKRQGIKLLPWSEIQAAIAKGEMHPAFIPASGCFGFIHGNLILGQRHHQEIMYRLLENGWTWEQLYAAPQAWGWFSIGNEIGLRFSSDAGFIHDDEQEKCKAAFAKMFGKQVKDQGGYGGKSEAEFGGNFKSKYGDPEEQDPNDMEGYKAQQNSTILTPLPEPPTAVEAMVLPLIKAKKKKKKTKSVRYHGLHHPHVLKHVWRYHDYFESCVPHPDDHDGDDSDTPSVPATSSEPAVS